MIVDKIYIVGNLSESQCEIYSCTGDYEHAINTKNEIIKRNANGEIKTIYQIYEVDAKDIKLHKYKDSFETDKNELQLFKVFVNNNLDIGLRDSSLVSYKVLSSNCKGIKRLTLNIKTYNHDGTDTDFKIKVDRFNLIREQLKETFENSVDLLLDRFVQEKNIVTPLILKLNNKQIKTYNL